jgi:hypothetical protein
VNKHRRYLYKPVQLFAGKELGSWIQKKWQLPEEFSTLKK